MFNQDVALKLDLIDYIKRFQVEPRDLRNFDRSTNLTIPVANNNVWLAYQISQNPELDTIPLRNNRGNILGNTVVDDNELITFGQVKGLIKSPFTPKGKVDYVYNLSDDVEPGWLYIVENSNQPTDPHYNPNYPTINAGDMVVRILDESLPTNGYWETFSDFLGLTDITLQKVLENGNVSDKQVAFGNKLTVQNTEYKVELNTYLDQGFLTVKTVAESGNTIHFGFAGFNNNSEFKNKRIIFKTPINETETVAYESDLKNYVSFKEIQNKTEEEKSIARLNIGVDNMDMFWVEENW